MGIEVFLSLGHGIQVKISMWTPLTELQLQTTNVFPPWFRVSGGQTVFSFIKAALLFQMLTFGLLCKFLSET